MIVKLMEDKIVITAMKVPEILSKVFVELIFEEQTEHLTVVMQVGKTRYVYNRLFVDFTPLATERTTTWTVELLDAQGHVVKKYVGEFPLHHYIAFGPKPVHPDSEVVIRDLTIANAELKARVKFLEERGEVV